MSDTKNADAKILASHATRRFLWLDVETTGLDPRKDLLLEVAAWISRSADPFDLDEDDLKSWVVGWEGETLGKRLSSVTWKMHCANGLIPEVITSKLTLGDVDSYLADLITAVSKGDAGTAVIHLAGNSVYLDLGFLRAYLPDSAKLISHRLLDVSAVKLAVEAVGYTFDKAEPAHRAADDVRESVTLLRTVVGKMRGGK